MNKYLKTVFFIIGLGVFAWLISDFGISNIIENVKRSGWWFLPVVGVWAIVYYLNAWAWYYVIDAKNKKVPFINIYGITLSGFAINYITPFVNLGGEPYRVIALKDKIGLHSAVSAVILYTMLHFLSHFIFWITAIILAGALLPLAAGVKITLLTAFVILSVLIWFIFSRHKKGIFSSLINFLSKLPFLKSLHKKLIMTKHLLLFSLIVSTAACSMFTANPNDVEEKNGLTYLKGTNKPFTGRCIGKYDNEQDSVLYNYNNGNKNGDAIAWYKNGQKKYQGKYINGIKEGEFNDWFEDGKISAIRNYLHGIENGKWKIWHEDGILKEEGYFINGQRDGLWHWYYENGQKWVEINFTNGKEHGIWTAWHENGQKREEVNYQNGKKDGLWQEWNKDGQIILKGLFSQGHENGNWYGWYDNSKPRFEKLYKNGDIVYYLQWNESGKPIETVK